jgi:hypothetical protein
VNSNKLLAQLCLKILHSGAQYVYLPLSVDTHIIPSSVDPFNISVGQ